MLKKSYIAVGLIAFLFVSAAWLGNNREQREGGSSEAPVFPIVSFPLQYTQSLVVATFEGDVLLKPQQAQAVVKREEEGRVLYENAYFNVDVVYEKDGNIIKESIILKNKSHPEEFIYTIEKAPSYDVYKEVDGSMVFYRKGARKRGYPRSDKLFKIAAPFMKDARGIYSSTDEVEMRFENGKLIIVPDKEWLSKAQYPVIVDPTIELNILNVQSYPEVGGLWEVRFTTTGVSDLRVAGDRKNTIFGKDVEFVSLRCGLETRVPQEYGNNGYIYRNWECDEEAKWIVRVLQYGIHHQVFEFGGQRQDAYNSTISGVQSGTATIASGSATQTVTITAVDTTKSFLVFSVQMNDNAPECTQISGQITNSTTLTFSRDTACATSAITVQWYVAEFSSGVSVQRGSRDMSTSGTGVENVSITAVNRRKSFPIISMRKAGTAYDNDDFVRARFTADDTLQLSQQDSASPSGIVEWQVVEYDDSFVQWGDVSWGTTDATKTVTVNAVDTAKSWLMFYYNSAGGTAADIGQKLVRGEITNSTTLTFTRANTGQAMDMTWFLVEFNDNTTVQKGAANFTSTDTVKDVTISSVTTGNSIATLSGWNLWGGSTAYNVDDNPGVAAFTAEFTTATNLRLTRALTGSVAADASWFVIDFSNTTPAITSVVDTPDPTNPNRSVTFIIDWDDPGDYVKAKVCKTNSLTNQNCDGGFWASSTAFTTNDPVKLTYDIVSGDAGQTRNYYAFVCDDGGLCSSVASGSFSVNAISSVPNIKVRKGFKFR